MRYRKLGNTGMEVSEIGFGGWGIGGGAYGSVVDSESLATLRAAFDRGVTFYDTSDLYGDGHSEVLIGQAFEGKRDEVIIASKGGTLPHKTFVMPQDFSPSHLRSALEGSLRRLGTDYIDVYQLHSPWIADLDKEPEAIATLESFREEGKIRAYGVSARSPEEGKRFIETYGIPVLQVNFNMADQRALDCGFFASASSHEAGVIIRTPLVFGYLTGKMTGKENLEETDHRANWPKEQLTRWADSANLFESLVHPHRSLVQLALRFCLDQVGTSTVIPGMLQLEHVIENTSASALPALSEEEIAEIQNIFQSNEFYDRGAKAEGEAAITGQR